MTRTEWEEFVHTLPCVVCFLQTGAMHFPAKVEGHHLEAVRDNLSDWLQVPLCWNHHQGPNGVHGLSRRGFNTRYNLDDLSLIAGTLKLAAMRNFK